MIDKANGFAYSALLSNEQRSKISDLILNEKTEYEYFKLATVREKYFDEDFSDFSTPSEPKS